MGDGLLSVDLARAGSCPLVLVGGEIDTYTVRDLSATLDELLTDGAVEITLDLGEVVTLSSEGLAALVHVARRLDMPSQLRLRAPSTQVRKVLEISGLHTFFTLDPDSPREDRSPGSA